MGRFEAILLRLLWSMMAQYFGDLIVTDVCLILGQSFFRLIETARCFLERIHALGCNPVWPVFGFKEWRQLADCGWSALGVRAAKADALSSCAPMAVFAQSSLFHFLSKGSKNSEISSMLLTVK